MKKNKVYLLALICMVAIFSGCASSYRPVLIDNLSYASVAEADDVGMQYRYETLRASGNKKYVKKENSKNIRVVAVEFMNASYRPINFRDDIEIYSDGRRIIPLEPLEAKQKLKQIAPLYLLWSFLWVVISKCDGEECSSTPIPVGALIGIGNMGVAAGANKHLLEDLLRYNILDKTIEPGETVNGLITIAVESGQPLEIRMK